ncbi:hypothetical protein J8273_2239 [Carpediemonas membranifera]|uniref:Uncharacterized protein n=1 Tax=Carpediemonas membranifera TaxID=201153 RepID=A0A8J6E154_9EUKA|nr:hypothetical protein J8273_2239 [Carpediemonas membranifera]|eukprot:KAG9395904.1 hypothetical protein J8273_2239 [Carpediemonas membranifera]
MLKLVPNVPGDDNPADWLARHMENLPDEGPLWRSFEARDALIKDNRSSLMNRDHPWRRWEMSMDLEEVLRASGHSFRRGGAVHMMKMCSPSSDPSNRGLETARLDADLRQ